MSAFDWGRFQLDAFQIDQILLGDCEQDYVEAGYVEAGYICTDVVAKVGGDDAFHPGWNRKAWKKKQKREEALEETIRLAYLQAMGIAPEPEVVRTVVKEAVRDAPKPSTLDYSGVSEWLQAQQLIVAQILAKRAEEDDEEAFLLLI